MCRAASTTSEFDLQRRGYAAAIVSDKLMEAIHSGPHGAIALAYVEWAGEGEQTIVVDWTVLRNSTDAQKFAAALTASPRSFLGRTAIGSALDFAMGLFAEGGIAADRKVIDVSGDGTSNQGRAASEARDAAVKAGAVVNGLSIFNRRAAAQGGYLALHTNPPGGLAQVLPRQRDRRPRRLRAADRRLRQVRRRDDPQADRRDRRRATNSGGPPQNGSTHGLSSNSQVQALRGWRRACR